MEDRSDPADQTATSRSSDPWEPSDVTSTIAHRLVGVALLTLVGLTTACSPSWRNDNAAPIDIDVAADGTSELTLYVSNQSYVDRTVDITVTLDGATIIERGFNVGDQHNHIEHNIQLDHGPHTLTAITVIDGNALELSEEFIIDPAQHRYALLSYWHYVPTRAGDTSFDPPTLNFEIQDEPIGFD